MGEAEYVVDIWVVGVDNSVVDGRDRLEVWCCRVGCSEAVGRLWRYILILLIFSCCWSIFLSIFLSREQIALIIWDSRVFKDSILDMSWARFLAACSSTLNTAN